MSRPPTSAILLLVLAAHPLFNVFRLVGGRLAEMAGLPSTFPVAELAFVVELVIAAGITWQLRPAVAAWGAGPVTARPPGQMQPSLDGFRARMERPWAVGTLLRLVGVGVAASCAGVFLQLTLEMLWDPVGWEIDHAVPLPLPIMLFGLFFVATVATALHALAQGAITLLVVFARAHQSVRRSRQLVELTGRTLRVGKRSVLLGPDAELRLDVPEEALHVAEGGVELTVWGDPRELTWMAEQFRQIRVEGSFRDVPQELQRARERT